MLATMVAVAGLMLRPRIGPEQPAGRSKGGGWPWLLAIGFYGGFVQAGSGLLLIAFLSGRQGFDLLGANAIKAVIILAFSSLSLCVFLLAGQVAWAPAILLAVATVIGARLGVRFALSARDEVIRRIVFAMVLMTCLAAAMR